MKLNTFLAFTMTLALTGSAFSAEKPLPTKIASKTMATPAPASDETASTSAASSNPNAGKLMSYGFGFSSETQFVKSGTAAFTALLQFTEKLSLQPLLGMDRSKGPGAYGFGALLKYTTSGTFETGFHVGGGFGIGEFGSKQQFIRLGGLAGFHHTFGEHIQMHLDGGLVWTTDEQTAGARDDDYFTFRGNSGLLGLSMVYMF